MIEEYPSAQGPRTRSLGLPWSAEIRSARHERLARFPGGMGPRARLRAGRDGRARRGARRGALCGDRRPAGLAGAGTRRALSLWKTRRRAPAHRPGPGASLRRAHRRRGHRRRAFHGRARGAPAGAHECRRHRESRIFTRHVDDAERSSESHRHHSPARRRELLRHERSLWHRAPRAFRQARDHGKNHAPLRRLCRAARAAIRDPGGGANVSRLRRRRGRDVHRAGGDSGAGAGVGSGGLFVPHQLGRRPEPRAARPRRSARDGKPRRRRSGAPARAGDRRGGSGERARPGRWRRRPAAADFPFTVQIVRRPPSWRTSRGSSFRRDAETSGRDARAPRSSRPRGYCSGASFDSRSGRTARVFASACSRRHFAISP